MTHFRLFEMSLSGASSDDFSVLSLDPNKHALLLGIGVNNK